MTGGAAIRREWLPGWIALALLLGAHSAAAQAKADSTARAAPGDPVATRSQDTTAAGPAAAPDSAAPRAAADSSARAPIHVASPVDTLLARACASAPGRASAPGLLAVVFRAAATDSDRVAAAREVGGTLAGIAARGEQYIRLPENGGPIRIAAASLIQLSSVSSVSEISCPR